MDAPRPRNADEKAQFALTAVEKLREDMETFKLEIRHSNHALYEQMGKLMRAVSHSDANTNDTKAIVERLERHLIGEFRPPAPSHHDVEEIAKRVTREETGRVEEIAKRAVREETGRNIIPPMSMPSDRVRETIKNERNELVVGVLAKVAIALVIAFALLGAGMAIRDCQHGSVPAQLH